MAESVLIPKRDYNRLWSFLAAVGEGGPEQRSLLGSLERVLTVAKPLPESMVPSETVTLNSLVPLREKQTGVVLRFQLVFPWDSDVEQQKLSVLSAIGTAILGRLVGQEIRCRNGERDLELHIEEVDREGPTGVGTDVE